MESNIRNTIDIKNNCIFCKHFESYHDAYEDSLEPNDFGFCHNDKNKDSDKLFGEGTVCDLFVCVGAK